MTNVSGWIFAAAILYVASLATCIVENISDNKIKDVENVECLKDAVLDFNSTKHHIDIKCFLTFTDYYKRMQKRLNYTQGQMDYLFRIEKKMLNQLYNTARRHKRQIDPDQLLPTRRECRTLSDAERDALFETIVQIKQDSADGRTPNYDTIAGLHNQQAFNNAHNGPNFLSWHRVYLAYFETALNDIRERLGLGYVALCYWDSNLDFLMAGDSQSRTIAFSDSLFGNGRGAVINGRFANWRLPQGGTLRRSIGGAQTSLMRPSVVDLIATDPSINRHASIVRGNGGFFFNTNNFGFPDPDNRFQRISLESEHDGVHAWVGGIMQNVNASPNDPVFWFHHTFIDYVWELFRQKIEMMNVDPTQDYPFVFGSHNRDSTMINVGFPGVLNIDGYNRTFERTYSPSPTCSDGCGGNTQFLYCPAGGSGNDRCVSREISADVAPAGAAQEFAPASVAAFGARGAMVAATAPQTPLMTPLETADTIALRTAQSEGPIILTGPVFQSSFADPRLS